MFIDFILKRFNKKQPDGRIRLRNKQLGDAVDDYQWRKDHELAHLDAIEPISIDFQEFFKAYHEELDKPDKNYRHFAIETVDGRHIGNCMLYDIDKKKNEVQIGILIGNRTCWDKGYGREAVKELLEKAFGDMEITKVYLQTLSENIRAQKCFAHCGFVPCGYTCRNGYQFVIMEIYRSQWARRNGN